MRTVFRVIVVLPAILFLTIGLRWLVDPTAIATEIGVVLGEGVGRSSQIADFAAFFLTLGLCILMGVIRRQSLWFYPPILLLLLAAVG